MPDAARRDTRSGTQRCVGSPTGNALRASSRPRPRSSRRWLAAALAAGLLAPALSPAAEAPAGRGPGQVMLVLDASGSMWGRVGDRTKIEVAREAVATLVRQWEPGIPLGLIAYGHRRKGDCKDIETVVPVGPLDPEAVIRAANALDPKGKTPLTDAVRLAAEQMKYTEDQATVILVSDGLETCDRDPCAVARELEQAGVDFTAHVIGFDLSAEDAASLRCLAENTGGRFTTASDADGLVEALGAAVHDVRAAVKPGLTVMARMSPESAPLADKVWFSVFAIDEQGHRAAQPVETAWRAGAALFQLPTGRYAAQAGYLRGDGPALASTEVDVDASEAQTAIVDLDAGRLVLSTTRTTGEAPLTENLGYRVFAAEAGPDGKRALVAPLTFSSYFTGEPGFLPLPAGRYHVTVHHGNPHVGPAFAEADVRIQAGETTEQVLNLRAGTAALRTILNAGGAAPPGKLAYRIFRAEPGPDGKRVQVGADLYQEPAPEFVLSQGSYLITVHHDNPHYGPARAEAVVEVQEGQRVEQVLDLRAATVTLKAMRAGAPVPAYLELFRLGAAQPAQPERLRTWSSTSSVAPEITEGRYSVRASADGKQASVDFDVQAGQAQEVVVNLD